ncbi:pyridoxal phosphate-dependent aminotransferase [Nitrosospira multiformis]|uniref:Aminotransferase n=1 Tax=Nitrosospira multiformis (strain ATCC 25196 / NCIMB 11849 / C 71) TaxID=323848 RepID=Q2Y9A8_NITMU|nr:pyridoxal phosphate-dependent aminotransferase [Nitrosospira multiformis]ABB74663.1 aminotransferase [Nitrosospira multiformis ATCC 25196]SDZ83999.1 aspartate aminotransferase [Nitrosospira multiformis]SEF72815.1 aspartate aminotransferase [Nitrosospira multiformis ATCC 25196]
MELSKRVQAIKPSPTLAVTARAARLKAEGKDIIGLGAGEPDFDTPQHIKDAAVAAIQRGFTKYTAVGGTPGLKNAIIAKFKRENGFDYTAGQILVSCGGKQSFFNLTLSVINPGDEVIIPAPYWVSYPDIVLIAEGKPVIVEAGIEQGFKITAAQLERAITPKTRMFVINSPSNPSGGVYTLDELKALGEVLLGHPHILIATDDMYEHILLSEGKFVNILNACPALYPRTVVLNGVSKAYAMTGWRIGYCAGPAHIITAMENVQSQSTSNPASISQVAAETALNGDQSCITPMVEAFRQRNRFVTDALNGIAGIRCLLSEGAFYAFADAREAIARLHGNGMIKDRSDIAFSEYLLEQGGVAVVPGSAFGSEGYIRLSFATAMSNLEGALGRMARLLG